MGKFKVKMTCPGFNKGSIIETDFDGHVPDCYNKAYYDPRLYNNIFEEIKEPLFITEDGEQIFEGDSVFGITSNNTVFEWFDKDSIYIDKGKASNVFSSILAAENWIEQNKPKFSIKQINDAIEKIESFGIEFTIIRVPELKKELGI